MTDNERKNALALKLFVTDEIKQTILEDIDASIESLGKVLGELGKAMSFPDLKAKVKGDFERQADSLLTEMALTVAGLFDLEDLEALDAFYQTPTGKKLIQNMSELNSRLSDVVGSFGERMEQTSNAVLSKLLN